MNIYWTPYRHSPQADDFWKDMVWIEPEPVFPEVAASRKGKDHMRCAGVYEYMRNVFVIRAPVDYTLTIDESGNCSTSDHTKHFFDSSVTFRSHGEGHRLLTIEWMYLFYADKTVMMEALPPIYSHDQLSRDLRVIAGTFDISKWMRPLPWAFEILDGVSEIKVKRGDPLMYVRFVSPTKVKLVRVDHTPELTRMVDTCVEGSKFFVGKRLSWLYGLAEPVIKRFRRSRCPFRKMMGLSK